MLNQIIPMAMVQSDSKKIRDFTMKIWSPILLIVGLLGSYNTNTSYQKNVYGAMTFLGAVGLVLPTIDKMVKDGN